MSVPLEVDCATTKRKLDAGEPLFFVDCREADEFAVARIDGATLIPMSEMADRLADFQPHADKPIIVHCHHGGRSLRVAMWLRQQGYLQAQSMAGGIDQWSQVIDQAVPRY
jgi:rhodanese-related sulfurtransferase